MTTLTQIQSEIHELMAEMANMEDQSELQPLYEELTEMLEQQIDNYLYMIRQFEQQAEVQQKEANRLAALASDNQRKADWLKQNLKDHMEHTQTKRMSGMFGKVSLCKNGGKQPIWFNPDISVEELPEQLTMTQKMVDRQAIRSLCDKDGEVKLGDRIVAKLLERSHHLRIK